MKRRGDNGEKKWVELIELHTMFHRSFLRILSGSDPLQHTTEDCGVHDLRGESQIHSVNSADDIIRTVGHYIQGVKRPQSLVETHGEYYVARDLKTNTVYMCYKKVLMLDIDNAGLECEELVERLRGIHPAVSFQIYKTAKGYHAFCVSKRFNYRSKETVEFMYSFKDLGVDIDYIRYCYIRGFCVRLNKKFDGETSDNYRYVTTTNPELVDATLKELVDLHVQKCADYQHDLNLANL